jgi:[ribosomal protein S5]-alanine N-acetyltransferase
MQLTTNRLIIRDLEDNDAKAFAENGNDEEIKFFNWYLPYPLTLAKAEKIITKRKIPQASHRWLYELGIVLKETQEFMGIVSLYDVDKPENKAKLGYWIGKRYRRKGYTKEAIEEIIRFAFKELKLNKISAKTMASNKKSESLLKKLNFRKVGIRRWDKVIEEKKYDVKEWELLNE